MAAGAVAPGDVLRLEPAPEPGWLAARLRELRLPTDRRGYLVCRRIGRSMQRHQIKFDLQPQLPGYLLKRP